jgi:hypothetical protein
MSMKSQMSQREGRYFDSFEMDYIKENYQDRVVEFSNTGIS